MWKILKWILFSCPSVERQQGKDDAQSNNGQSEVVKPKVLEDAPQGVQWTDGARVEIIMDGTCRCIGLCCCIHEGNTSIVVNQ